MITLTRKDNLFTLYLDPGVQYHIFHRGVPVALWYEGDSWSWQGEQYDVIVCTADEVAAKQSYRFKWSRYIPIDVADWRTSTNITAVYVEAQYATESTPYFNASYPFSLNDGTRIFVPARRSGLHYIALQGLDADGHAITRTWRVREYAMVPDLIPTEFTYQRINDTTGRIGFTPIIIEQGSA
jgi:hypothetical protein